MGLLNAEDFQSHVGKPFRFAGTSHVLCLDRVEVQEGSWPDRFARRPFLLIFTASASGPVLPEGLYTGEAEPDVSFELYLQPIQTPAAGRQDYQSVFG